MSSKRKELRRFALADRIDKSGIPMPSCSCCVRGERTCVVAPGHSRCSECVRRNSKCDVDGPSPADWEKLRKEELRLEAEEEAAALEEQEAFARRMRL